jgi:hypothetical protein
MEVRFGYLRAGHEDGAVDAPREGEDIFAQLKGVRAGSAACVPEFDGTVS